MTWSLQPRPSDSFRPISSARLTFLYLWCVATIIPTHIQPTPLLSWVCRASGDFKHLPRLFSTAQPVTGFPPNVDFPPAAPFCVLSAAGERCWREQLNRRSRVTDRPWFWASMNNEQSNKLSPATSEFFRSTTSCLSQAWHVFAFGVSLSVVVFDISLARSDLFLSDPSGLLSPGCHFAGLCLAPLISTPTPS